jgi:hypothetical protein
MPLKNTTTPPAAANRSHVQSASEILPHKGERKWLIKGKTKMKIAI